MRPSPRLESRAGRAARFGLVGVLATGLYAGLALAMEIAGLGAEAASVLAYVLAAAAAFAAHRRFTFRAGGAVAPQVVRFALTSGVGLLIAWAAPFLLVRVLQAPSVVGIVAVCGLVPVFNYVALSLFVFARGRGARVETPETV